MASASVDRHQLALPPELLYRVISHLQLGDILALGGACRYLHGICQSPAAYEHISVDRKINVRKLLRKCDRHYFVKTRSISLNSSPLNAQSLLEGKLQSFPRLASINLSHSPINLQQISQLAEYFAQLQIVKLCVGVPHVFPGTGFWSLEQCTQLRLVLVGLLSRLLQSGSIRELHLVFTLKDSICNIQSRGDVDVLCLDLSRVPRRVRIENFALFRLELTNHIPLFSNSHGVEEFLLKQLDPGINNFTVPLSFSLPAGPGSLYSGHRSLYLEHNALARPALQEPVCLAESCFHREYRSLNLIPEHFLNCIQYASLCYLDLSRVSAPVATKVSLDSMVSLRGLNISGQAALLLDILERVQVSALLPGLTELHVAGIQCSQLFDLVPKKNLLLLLSRLQNLRILTLTPCMTLLPSNSIAKENGYQSLKILKLDSYGICVPLLFKSCPRLQTLSVTDKNLIPCQLCVDEYANLKQTHKFLTPSSESAPIPLSRFSLYYKQGVIDNYSALLLEEISYFQLTTLTHFSIQTNRNFLTNILCKFITNNSDLLTLRIESPINFTPAVFKAMRGLVSLQNLFLIGSAASDANVLERALAELPRLEIVWLHFKSLSATQGKELQSRLTRLELRAAQDGNLTVNYSNRQSPLADRMYASIAGYLYSRSGIK